MIRPVAAPTRETLRRSIADQLLESLDQLVTRHRALALHDEHIELHAELIAAEVAHQLAMTRSALHRHPPLRRAQGRTQALPPRARIAGAVAARGHRTFHPGRGPGPLPLTNPHARKATFTARSVLKVAFLTTRSRC